MCGINGFNWKNKKLISEMNDSLKHRGPDGDGIFSNEKLSLGQRRLAILDLSKKGAQPMTYKKDGHKIVITFNGEIYNFQALRKQLEIRGYEFNSDTDTEVVLASYLEWGANCVKKFNGMWAFCIYDHSKNMLFLSRDRAGKKPLYYYFDGDKLIFSSELKGILNHKIALKINPEAIDLYLSMGFIPSPLSIYKNVFKIEPRQNLYFNIKNKKIKKEYYYLPKKYSPLYNRKKLIEECKKIMKDSVELRMISDVPVGAFLSGGLDSSAIVEQMSNFTNARNLHTFSIGFREGNDETNFAKLMKDALGTKHHHRYFVKRNFNELLTNIYNSFDEPFFDHSMFPSVPLSNMAKKEITVSLSGDGGDEVFGGYPRYQKALIIEKFGKIPLIIRKILVKILPNKNKLGEIREGMRLSLLKKEDFYSEARREIYKPLAYKKLMRTQLKRFLNLTDGNLTEAVIMMDLYFYTVPDHFLTKTDRASMSESLEVRCPFLDCRFLDLAVKIPTRWKVSPFKTKILMRKILKDILPKKILRRKKEGFMPPIVDWINKNEDIKEARELLFNKGILSEEWKRFFEKINDKNDMVSKGFKTRLFLLKKWHEQWLI
jgi:asparagine synthase (glutamine-hydrolysing)